MKSLIFLLNLALLMTASAKSIYEHDLKSIDGESTTLAEHKGKVILMVNVASVVDSPDNTRASKNFTTNTKTKGLVVCGFPNCNQFGGQEPGSESEIKEFCSTKFGVTFPMYSKIDVNGANRHPIYKDIIGEDGPLKGNIKWNFGKILVGKDGKPIDRFGSMTSPSSKKLIQAIEEALQG